MCFAVQSDLTALDKFIKAEEAMKTAARRKIVRETGCVAKVSARKQENMKA